MNKKALKILEFNKIIEFLKAEAGCAISKDMASRLKPGTDAHSISESLRSTTEAVDLIVHKGALPTEGIYNISDIANLAFKGMTLTMKQLLMVHRNLAIAGNVIHFLKGEIPEIPSILDLAELIETNPALEQEIDRCILSEDEMADNASKELFRLRQSIIRQNAAVRNRLERMALGVENRSYLQDSIVTMRDGRYVIPVKAEHRAKFPGIVHDHSKGGQTLFVEPQVIVDMNNELRELQIAERAEVNRILGELSERVGENAEALKRTQNIIAELDFIMAKGKLSVKMHGTAPIIDNEGCLEIYAGRHPMLNPDTVVPIDVALGRDYRTLVITGPNTGGKTLTLKTIGLLSMMAQSGLHIPADNNSRMPIYDDIFADIGDEQSIEQNLSTFSSHMKNIVFIVNNASENTLVLLDELGSGTDPTEGAALAQAVLEELRQRKVSTAATTHYNEIKKYALSTEGVENASMEFDIKTLSPTFKLLVGVAGSSNAFQISRKLGLPKSLIEKAAGYVESRDAEFEELIKGLESDQRKAQKDRDEAKSLNLEIKREKEELDRKLEALEKDKEKLIADARRQARAILKDARDTANDVQKELRKIAKMDSLGQRNESMAHSKRKLKKKEEKYAERIVQRVNSNPVSAKELKIGDKVKLLTLEQNGEIISLPDAKDELTVQIGQIKMKANLKDLVLINDGSKKAQKKTLTGSSVGRTMRATMEVYISCDVRGEAYEDARIDVEKYLDNAFIAGLSEVTIIHGRGEGILKNGIRKMLKSNKHVASFRPGAYNEGGEGVTIVTIKR